MPESKKCLIIFAWIEVLQFSIIKSSLPKKCLNTKGQLNSECQPKITKIFALPSNKLPGQKSWKFLVGILGKMMTS